MTHLSAGPGGLTPSPPESPPSPNGGGDRSGLSNIAAWATAAAPSPAAEEFVALAGSASRPLLEIGAAYGNATLPALRAGATVIANDVSASELGVLASTAPQADRRRLVLMPARFPEEIRLGDGSL